MPAIYPQKKSSRFSSLNIYFRDHKLFSFFTVVLLALAIPLTTFAALQNTHLLQHASVVGGSGSFCSLLGSTYSPSHNKAGGSYTFSAGFDCTGLKGLPITIACGVKEYPNPQPPNTDVMRKFGPAPSNDYVYSISGTIAPSASVFTSNPMPLNCNIFITNTLSMVYSHIFGSITCTDCGHRGSGDGISCKTLNTYLECEEGISTFCLHDGVRKDHIAKVTRTTCGYTCQDGGSCCTARTYTECEQGNPTYCLTHGVPAGHLAQVTQKRTCGYSCKDLGPCRSASANQ